MIGTTKQSPVNKIGIASDHAGYDLKAFVSAKLKDIGYDVIDFGNDKPDPADDFPDYVIPLARAVAAAEVWRGIAVCGSGVGACVAANKVQGVRACLITDTFSAHQGVEDDDMNLLCLGGRITGQSLVWEITEVFLKANFIDVERHVRRLEKIARIDNMRNS